ncbi:HD-GYP domain-containing protein [Azohydromonas australica]|uniref:HD-GYP domain-containing protein n=1 Tax=Azohydromonas australica TaxID=364039 RepID=UPI00048E4A92|nr:HD-GYP domain-containing protein [Azohydromonas australica]
MSSLQTIDVRDLRPGMYVQLDLSWISHPFPRSSFVISSEAQIDTIRGLGLQRVRWDPLRSVLPRPGASAAAAMGSDPDEIEDEATEPPPEAAVPQEGVDPAAQEAQGASAAEVDAGDTADAEPQAAAAATAPAAALSPEEVARRQRRQLLAAQRAAQQQCERCYGDAIRGLREASELLRAGDPVAARQRTEALTSELLQRMLGDPESCIRLLTEGAGDRSSAHALNVTVISLLLGRLLNLPESELQVLGLGALLHDIGKVYLPERMRTLDEQFTPAELKLYREHVALGVLHGRRMGLSAQVMLVIGQHHELADGSGFPQQMELARLTQAARIVGLVNRYDNLCNPPLPANALTPHEALSLLFTQSQTKYDQQLVSAFVRMMGVYPPGSVVQLTDERYALVSGVNAARPLKPRVLVFDPSVPREEATVLDLEHAPGLGIRRSLKPALLPREVQQYLCPHQRVAWFFDAGPAPLVPERRA